MKGSVLSKGQTVEATNKNGRVRISYVSPIKRKYEWDGNSRIIKMIRRPEPFQGKLGLYEPADSWGLNKSAARCVVEESVRDFENEEQVKAALIEGSAIMDWVYTPDGLVVGFGATPSRNQINVDLWQFLIHGQKPTGLAGARPDHIRLSEGH